MKRIGYILNLAFVSLSVVKCLPAIQETGLASLKSSENGVFVIRFVSDVRLGEQEIVIRHICLSEPSPELTLSTLCGGKLLFYNERIKLGEERKFYLAEGNYTGRILIYDQRGFPDETVIGLVRFSNANGNSSDCNSGLEAESLPIPLAESIYFNYLDCKPLVIRPGKKVIVEIFIGSQIDSYFWSWLFRKLFSSGFDGIQGYLRYSSFSIRYE